MDKIIIKGGNSLQGQVNVDGSKKATLILQAAAAFSTQGTVTLENVPAVADMKLMNQLLESLNIKTAYGEKSRQLVLNASFGLESEIAADYLTQLPDAWLLAIPIMVRTGHARVALPEDYDLKEIDMTLRGLEILGAQVKRDKEAIELNSTHLVGTRFQLSNPSLMTTLNLILAATTAQGLTTIENASADPEVIELGNFLNKMGAQVHGAGTTTIRVQGVSFMRGAQHTVVPDRIEAGTWMVASAITNGDVIVHNIIPAHNAPLITALTDMGATIIKQDNGLRVLGTSVLLPAVVHSGAHFGLSRDLEAQVAALMMIANGVSRIEHDDESGFDYLEQLQVLDGQFSVDGQQVEISGPAPLVGQEVQASDYRTALSLVLAGLAASGITQVKNPHHVDDAILDFIPKLQKLGGKVDLIHLTDDVNGPELAIDDGE
ncbi:MAG: UDP-N-acetylglucosamine 1-carboxyvinyltransferase [Limosilactobacillus sp.]|uniref:UDP-N-acetylglucosamine 1-carboxyvinyltransferase n=1 Tax=Limosilactobacillus sp. TaxID=2773925 RepID=UPI0026F83FD9|nr:UDP-N-acetylglucosamine 1-carboxyvinyltransferase [Limosilactobacillus sp.]